MLLLVSCISIHNHLLYCEKKKTIKECESPTDGLAMDSCFGLVGRHQHGLTVGQKKRTKSLMCSALYCRGYWPQVARPWVRVRACHLLLLLFFFVLCQVFCRVNLQNSLQKHTTKNFARFPNHFTELTMGWQRYVYVTTNKRCVTELITAAKKANKHIEKLLENNKMKSGWMLNRRSKCQNRREKLLE